MIPGPDIIIACRACDALATVLTQPPAITKCISCGSFYWILDARKVGEYSRWDKETNVDPAWKEAPEIQELTEDEYYHAIDIGLGSTREKEKHLRLLTWRCSNNRFRNSSTTLDPNREDRCRVNMLRLYDLLETDDTEECLTKAELARQLGDFNKAFSLATSVTDPSADNAKSYLLSLCAQRTTAVRQYPNRNDAE